ncbi:MAG TPA: FAD-dependent monooxygenase, partial [Burkholderiaceae bacterium]|nr:FAD-dependent monooxygenase [Burkholderiaceae bacterium]
MADARILIVGAGPTGLVLALTLARQGVACRIVDRSPAPGLASRAMAVQARTLELYDQLGFADEVVALGIPMKTFHLREGGEEVARIRLSDIGADLSPYPFALCFAQDDHERFLAARLRALGVEVERGVSLDSLEQDEQGVRAVLRREGGVFERVEADFLCGCDGAHSTVRQALGIGFPGGTYEQAFYVADVRAEGVAEDDLFVSVDADTLALMLPVRSSGMKRFIGMVPRALGAVAQPTFENIRPHAEALLGVRVSEVHWFSTYRVHHRVADRFQLGRVFIAGDAGHVHSPAGGQGMNTGIGDAYNLAWKLALVARGAAPPALLASYEPERIAFARKLVESTDRAFEAVVGRGWAGKLVRTALLPLVLPVATDFEAVRRMIFRTVSQIRINYRESPLSDGRAGELHAGDRLPWVAVPGGGSNFDALRARCWRLQVYGTPQAALEAAAARAALPL